MFSNKNKYICYLSIPKYHIYSQPLAMGTNGTFISLIREVQMNNEMLFGLIILSTYLAHIYLFCNGHLDNNLKMLREKKYNIISLKQNVKNITTKTSI